MPGRQRDAPKERRATNKRTETQSREMEIRRFKNENKCPFPYVDDCGRIKCCLCFSRSTNKLIGLRETVHVPACAPCFYHINKNPLTDDQMRKIVERVEKKVKAPIAFFVETTSLDRRFNDALDTKFKTRTSYNRYKPTRVDARSDDAESRKRKSETNVGARGGQKRSKICSKEFVDTETEEEENGENENGNDESDRETSKRREQKRANEETINAIFSIS